MIPMVIKLDGDNAWPDLQAKPFIHLGEGSPAIQLAVLGGGMKSGRPSVALRFELPDGRTVVAETSARLFCTAAKAIMARHPALFEGD
jgi:hypothetical protein